jgi:hypothetical protein
VGVDGGEWKTQGGSKNPLTGLDLLSLTVFDLTGVAIALILDVGFRGDLVVNVDFPNDKTFPVLELPSLIPKSAIGIINRSNGPDPPTSSALRLFLGDFLATTAISHSLTFSG